MGYSWTAGILPHFKEGPRTMEFGYNGVWSFSHITANTAKTRDEFCVPGIFLPPTLWIYAFLFVIYSDSTVWCQLMFALCNSSSCFVISLRNFLKCLICTYKRFPAPLFLHLLASLSVFSLEKKHLLEEFSAKHDSYIRCCLIFPYAVSWMFSLSRPQEIREYNIVSM